MRRLLLQGPVSQVIIVASEFTDWWFGRSDVKRYPLRQREAREVLSRSAILDCMRNPRPAARGDADRYRSRARGDRDQQVRCLQLNNRVRDVCKSEEGRRGKSGVIAMALCRLGGGAYSVCSLNEMGFASSVAECRSMSTAVPVVANVGTQTVRTCCPSAPRTSLVLNAAWLPTT